MKRVMFYGDSNTWGYNGENGCRFPENVRFTGLLAQKFAGRYAVVEEGLNGRTTAFQDDIGPCRNGYTYLPVTLFSNDPLDLVVFMLGTNDCKRRISACVEEIVRGMELLIQEVRNHSLIREKKTAMALIAPPPMEEFAIQSDFMFDKESVEKSRQLSIAFEHLSWTYGLHFIDAGKICRPGNADGVHLDAAGHKQLAEVLANYLPVWLG